VSTVQPQVTGRKAHSIEQVREQTGFCRDKIYQLIKDGQLVARKCGKRTIILDADLERFLDVTKRIGECTAATSCAHPRLCKRPSR